jgi:hypothetical protein
MELVELRGEELRYGAIAEGIVHPLTSDVLGRFVEEGL